MASTVQKLITARKPQYVETATPQKKLALKATLAKWTLIKLACSTLAILMITSPAQMGFTFIVNWDSV
jgi:hypothetical protein